MSPLFSRLLSLRLSLHCPLTKQCRSSNTDWHRMTHWRPGPHSPLTRSSSYWTCAWGPLTSAMGVTSSSNRKVQQWVLLFLLQSSTYTWSSLRALPLPRPQTSAGLAFGRDMLMKPSAFWGKALWRSSWTTSKAFVQPSSSQWKSREMDPSFSWTSCSGGRMMAALTVWCTESPHTLTATWTSNPTILTMSKGAWSDAYMTGPEASPAHKKSQPRRAPHCHHLKAEQLPWCLHPLLHLATTHPGPRRRRNGTKGHWHAATPTGNAPLCLRYQRGHQASLLEVWCEGGLQIREIPLVCPDQS